MNLTVLLYIFDVKNEYNSLGIKEKEFENFQLEKTNN